MSDPPPQEPREPQAPAPPQAFAEYPRHYVQYGATDWGPRRVDLGVLARAWPLVQAKLGIWLLAMTVVAVVLGGFYTAFLLALFGQSKFLFNPDVQPSAEQMLAFFSIEFVGMGVFSLLMYIFDACLFSLALQQVGGENIGVGGMFKLRGQFLQIVLASILTSVMVMVGGLFCVIPGFLLQGLFMFVFPLIIDKRMPVLEAIRVSFVTLKPQMWMAALAHFVLLLIAQFGAIACFVGMFVTYPIYIMSVALMYRDYFWERPAGAPPPGWG